MAAHVEQRLTILLPSLPNTSENPIVRHVRHALALDERRVRFQANPWNTLKSESSEAIDPTSHDQTGIPGDERSVKEVWFAGTHAGAKKLLNCFLTL